MKTEVGKQFTNELAAWRTALKKNTGSEDSSGAGAVMRPSESAFIKVGYDFSATDIDSAFDLDWPVMKWDWLHPTETQKNLMGDALKNRYALICNIFAHFCGTGQGSYCLYLSKVFVSVLSSCCFSVFALSVFMRNDVTIFCVDSWAAIRYEPSRIWAFGAFDENIQLSQIRNRNW